MEYDTYEIRGSSEDLLVGELCDDGAEGGRGGRSRRRNRHF